MTSRDNRARVHVEIPVETKQALKEADGSMWEVLDEGARMVMGLDEGSTEAAIENRIENIRQEQTEIDDQRQSLDQRLKELQEMEEDLTSQLESIRQKKETHRERLDAILDQMEDDPQSRPVLAWMSDLRDASMHEYGSESRDNMRRVVEDLRNRSAEEGRAIAPHRLSRTASAQGQSANADGGDEPDLRVMGDGGESDDE